MTSGEVGGIVTSMDNVISVVLLLKYGKITLEKFHVFVGLPVDFEVSDRAVNTASSDVHEGFSLENIFFPLLPDMKRCFSLLTDKWVDLPQLFSCSEVGKVYFYYGMLAFS